MTLRDANGREIKEYDDVRILSPAIFLDAHHKPHVVDAGHEGTIIMSLEDVDGRPYVQLESCSELMFVDLVPSQIEFVRSVESKLP